MNTRISFLYRDACNYKMHNEVVIKGEFEHGEEEEILDCLDDELYFIPEQVGLPVTRFGSVTEDDHAWCELEEDFATPTEDPATVDVTAEELYNAFCDAAGEWDISLSTVYGKFSALNAIDNLNDEELAEKLISRKACLNDDLLEKLIFLSGYCQWKLWDDEDIRRVLNDCGFAGSDENIAVVKGDKSLHKLSEKTDADDLILKLLIYAQREELK